MQIDAQDFLRLTEKAGTLAILDTESTGFKGDYNSLLVASVAPYGQKPVSFSVAQPGNDKKMVRELKDYLESFDAWVGYYSKGHDLPFINTRLLRWGLRPVAKRPHIDIYYTLKYAINTSRRSQGHLLSWLELPQQKMGVSAAVWERILYQFDKEIGTMTKRCESDVVGLESLYDRTKHLIIDIKR